MADPTQFWSAIFMFCSENGRWHSATYVRMYVRIYSAATAVLTPVVFIGAQLQYVRTYVCVTSSSWTAVQGLDWGSPSRVSVLFQFQFSRYLPPHGIVLPPSLLHLPLFLFSLLYILQHMSFHVHRWLVGQ